MTTPLAAVPDVRYLSAGAEFSEDRRHRYALWRRWEEHGSVLNVIGLNPSTADETQDDPTIRRCIRFARDWGHGALVVTNIFAFRSTDPKGLLAVPDPIGERNDFFLRIHAFQSATVLAAWGTHGKVNGRGAEVVRLLAQRPVYCLEHNRDGSPKHPLYVRADRLPVLL